jgi:hypothetical protein
VEAAMSNAYEIAATSRELVSQADEAIETHINSAQSRLRTTSIGEIVSINGQRATVRLLLRSVLYDGSVVSLPLIVDAPVVYPAGGNMIFTMPVAAGDECLVYFSDRCMEEWQQLGGLQTPEFRLHDIADGIVHVGISSDPKMLSDISTTSAELRSLDNSVKISVDPRADGIITLKAAIVNVVGVLRVNDIEVAVP